ncbi:MAG: hypothetical protein PWP24_1938 [Clostridiales bacterium]|nr:hypothetical protein [Clostridiales bacterium]
MNQMRKIIKKAAVVTLTSAMVVTTVPAVAPLVHVGAAAKTQIVVSNKRTVLVAGRTYSVKTKGATGFKSSNKKVATITKAGKISPKKTGYVNITAKVDGKTVTTKFLCVSKTGSTSSEAKVKKMPPNNPSQLFFGEKCGESLCLPKLNPKKYAPAS